MPYTGVGETAAPNPQGRAATAAASAPQGFGGAVNNLLNSADPASVTAGVSGAGQALNVAGSGLSMGQLLSELGLVGPSTQLQAQEAAQGLSYGLEGLGITQAGNTIAQQGNAAQAGLLNTQQAIEQGQYGLQQSAYPEQYQQAALQNQQAVQGIKSQGAIAGTLNTQGVSGPTGALATQAKQYGFTQEDIARNQSLSQLAQKGQQAQYQYSAGDIARAQQNLELAASQNGISYDQLISQFGQGLNQIGIQGDPTQLYTQYLAQQNAQVGAVGAATGQAGLVSPGNLANGAMAGGFNPNSLFSGIG